MDKIGNSFLHYRLSKRFSLTLLSVAILLVGCIQNSAENQQGPASSISAQKHSVEKDNSRTEIESSSSIVKRLVGKSDCIIYASCFQEVSRESHRGDTSTIVSEPRYTVHSVLFGNKPEDTALLKVHFKQPWVLGHRKIWFYKIANGEISLSTINGNNSVPSEKKEEVVECINRMKK